MGAGLPRRGAGAPGILAAGGRNGARGGGAPARGGARGAGLAAVALVPGNGGGGDIRGSNFYGWAEADLVRRGFDVRLPEGGMPDPYEAQEAVWVPFIRKRLLPAGGVPAILIGHSSGAAAALRVAEAQKLAGLVLVAAYDDDLGDALEAASGYFSRPWDWARIRQNCGFIAQFSGRRDSLVPVSVQRRVASSLCLEPADWNAAATDGTPLPRFAYFEDAEGDHFFEPPFPQLSVVIEQGLSSASGAEET